ncbi:phospholipid phosphatase 7 (inactive) [Rhinolophus ferrumequinum]|uniref:Phospholipid phosphatase 7 (Inactive) n=1 Tax=Rhinolophus ferrumequinum TaxID=59479 RepID=A0A7J7VS77_RHIFE|nr:phospholipid phosphatase 7 (inactive) [Rhinolophus ferrumequinum]
MGLSGLLAVTCYHRKSKAREMGHTPGDSSAAKVVTHRLLPPGPSAEEANGIRLGSGLSLCDSPPDKVREGPVPNSTVPTTSEKGTFTPWKLVLLQTF